MALYNTLVGNTLHNNFQYEYKTNQFGQHIFQPKNSLDRILSPTFKSLPGENIDDFLNRTFKLAS